MAVPRKEREELLGAGAEQVWMHLTDHHADAVPGAEAGEQLQLCALDVKLEQIDRSAAALEQVVQVFARYLDLDVRGPPLKDGRRDALVGSTVEGDRAIFA